ncbi:Uncharacterized protein TPAR_04305 [Tolypocladium paradoxum]|uniref:Uncharacterized protein n=1 Tax=Tolypocladium paradoxum TaxID=94208 RepID=A0A2S4KZ65_9HYPO|nr:Uncharacterized protein TPAR_04305 [Tolypocladium paradoxum]
MYMRSAAVTRAAAVSPFPRSSLPLLFPRRSCASWWTLINSRSPIVCLCNSYQVYYKAFPVSNDTTLSTPTADLYQLSSHIRAWLRKLPATGDVPAGSFQVSSLVTAQKSSSIADPRLQQDCDNMDPSDDPRANRPPGSMEAGPSRCNMLNMLYSSGFAEWAARAEAQNQRLGVSSRQPDGEASAPASSDSKSGRKSSSSSSSSRSSHKPPSSKKGSRSRKLKDSEEKSAKSRPSRPKPSEATREDDEQMDEADNFVAHYANYSSMDTELNILRTHLMQR